MPTNQDISEEVLVALRRIIRAIDLYSKELVRNYSLTGPQLLLLREIVYLRDTTVGGLAKRANLSSATVTGILDRLEKRGLVERTRSDHDRRKVVVRATAEGIDLYQKAPSMLQERFVSEFAKLHDWEQTLILSSLQHIATMMEAKDIEASPFLVSGPISSSPEESRDFFEQE